MVAKSRKHYSMDLDKAVHYSQLSKQQGHLHGCAGSCVPKSSCPEGVIRWTQAVDWSATGQPRAQGSSPLQGAVSKPVPFGQRASNPRGVRLHCPDFLSCHVTTHRNDAGPEDGWTLQVAFPGRTCRGPPGPPVVCLSQDIS